ncbi:putative prophage lambdaCh01, transcriptional regulator [Gottschalkia purinilytica]|uniref:Putative prophage lambdaCh01, transcriptional regulator n=1 Tax=Gottschalkia purinilytica TaxID=1503 RepID=A0A0L0W9W1_GOTPU|nr:helix-turn-helix transcriptional regulator [Gottschalkia purinilytica]KNF08095.1 putative prophage lambdaCh01, transcriptional regulator [Gottschalkia purinilytica]
MSYRDIMIYKIAREKSGLTQEEVIERLAELNIKLSTRQLSRYENEELIPTSYLVSRLMKIYNAEWLGYMHLQLKDDVGRILLPPVSFEDLGITVLKFQKEYGDIKEIEQLMIKMACDNKIDDTERQEWDQKVKKEVRELVSASLAVVYREEENSLEVV